MRSLASELLALHFAPERPNLDRARALVRGTRDGRSAWAKLTGAGLSSPGERLFRVTRRQLITAGHRAEDLRQINTNGLGRTPNTLALPHPGSVEAAVLFGSADRIPEAEAAARAFLERIEPFHFLCHRPPPPGSKVVVWRISGSPVASEDAGPSVCDIEAADDLVDLLYRLTPGRPRPFPYANRCQAACVHANALELWNDALPIPPQIKVGIRLVLVPRELIRKRPGALENPFEPLVQIWRLGFGVRRLSRETILLTMPELPGDEGSMEARRARTRAMRTDEAKLSNAAFSGRTAEVVDLLDRGIDPNAEMYGQTPLHRAVIGGHRTQAAMLGALLDAGADPDRLDGAGSTPLAFAVASDALVIMRAMLDLGFDRHRVLPGGRNLLHVAAEHGARRAAEALLDLGFSVASVSSSGRTPLHHAIAARRREVAATLLDRGADPNARDLFGFTPLHLAAIRGTNIDLLIARGALRLGDRYGRVPEDVAPEQEEQLRAAVSGASAPLSPIPSLRESPELEEAITSWDDASAWSVYADWLGEQNDPRADLIHVDLTKALAKGRTLDRFRREERALLLDGELAIRGELHRFYPRLAAPGPHEGFELRRGFLFALKLDDAAGLEGILMSRSARFLQRLTIPGTSGPIETVARARPPSLETLRLTRAPAPSTVVARIPRLPSIETNSPACLPALILPDLERLELRAFHTDRGPVAELAAHPPPKLARVRFTGPTSVLDALLTGPLVEQLEVLEIMRADREAVALLLSRGPRLRRLQRVKVCAFGVSTEDRDALRRRLLETMPRVCVR